MRVLVTGAAGFIGSHLSERLWAGHQVVGIDNYETGRRGNTSFQIHEGSVADRDFFYGIANHLKPDLIVHCAASYSNPDFWHRDTDTNVTGAINVALAARHHGARVVYFQTALPPTSSYAISKIAGQQYLELSAVPLTVFRLANVYGPRNLSGPIPTFYKRLAAGEPCTVMNTRRDMVYVADLITAVMAAIDREATGRFDICSGVQTPIEHLYVAVAMTLGGDYTVPQRQESGPDDVKQMELKGLAARLKLGWEASTTLGEGVEHAVAWYREHGVEQTYTHLVAR